VYYTPKEPSAIEVFINSNWLEAMNQEMEAIYKNDICHYKVFLHDKKPFLTNGFPKPNKTNKIIEDLKQSWLQGASNKKTSIFKIHSHLWSMVYH
jgi:hypothetical protein